RSHYLAAAGIEHEYAELLTRVVRDPEGKVRSEGKHIQHPHLTIRAAHAHDARAFDPQVPDVPCGIEEWHRLRAPARGARQEQRPELPVESFRHGGAPAKERPGQGRKTP